MPKPFPSSPSRSAAGHTYSTNSISHVADARIPSFGSVLPAWKPGSDRIDDERFEDALGALARRRDREQHDVLGYRAGRDPALLAIDDPVAVRVALGARVHRRSIRSRLRFSQCVGADCVAFRQQHARTSASALSIAVLPGCHCSTACCWTDDDRRSRSNRPKAAISDVHGQRVADRIEPGATVLVRHLDAHQAERSHLLDRLERKFAALVEFGGDRRDALLGEIARDGLDLDNWSSVKRKSMTYPRIGIGKKRCSLLPFEGEAGKGWCCCVLTLNADLSNTIPTQPSP